MPEWSVVADAGYALATATLFAFVGRWAGRRGTRGTDVLALSMFRVWWFGVAAFLGLGGILSVLEWWDLLGGPLEFTIAVLSMLAVCAAVWGLVYYVTYLYTGKSTSFLPGLAFYTLIFGGMVFALASDPTGRELGDWHQSVVRLAILTGPLLSAIIVAFLVPALAALGAYVALYRRVETRAQRFRLGLSAGSLMAWFGLAILAWGAGFADTTAWVYGGRGLALAAATGVLVAYAPPRWLMTRFGLAPEAIVG